MAAQRPVDAAMLSHRREKETVRALWIESAINHSQTATASQAGQYLYLTLPGAAAAEVELLIENGLITTTENGAISPESAHRLVCLESNQHVYLQLQTQYVGLKIVRTELSNLLHGHNLIRFPQGDGQKYCRALVVNLDLNEPWMTQTAQAGEQYIPVLRWVQKFAELHAEPPPVKWTLLLTLHGQCPWNPQQAEFMRSIIIDNSDYSIAARNELSNWLGDELLTGIEQDTIADYPALTRLQQQKLLMWLVPAMIIEQCVSQGWLIDVKYNLCYGTPPHAPMVTWVIDFQRPAGQQHSQQRRYRGSLTTILSNVGKIMEDGSINNFD